MIFKTADRVVLPLVLLNVKLNVFIVRVCAPTSQYFREYVPRIELNLSKSPKTLCWGYYTCINSGLEFGYCIYK